MSWLARSIADSLRIDDDDENTDEDDDDDERQRKTNPNHSQFKHTENDDVEGEDEEDRSGRGVREDITEFTETLTRQLWGVASFLAPPPPPLPPSRNRIDADWDRREVESPASEPEDDENLAGEAAGVTEEVLAFAMNIAHHPETWLDFPMEEEDDVDCTSLILAFDNYSIASVLDVPTRLRSTQLVLQLVLLLLVRQNLHVHSYYNSSDKIYVSGQLIRTLTNV